MRRVASRFVVAGAVAVGALLGGQPVRAHHSSVGQISQEVIEITGTIKEFQFKNPHSWIQVNVTGDNGDVVEWSVEWSNPNNLLRQGYGPNTFPPGAAVTIKMRQHVSGEPLGEFNAARFADGKTVGNWSGS